LNHIKDHDLLVVLAHSKAVKVKMFKDEENFLSKLRKVHKDFIHKKKIRLAWLFGSNYDKNKNDLDHM